MARFEREARVLASLNHPNIAAVYGLEESEGSHYLVMELVPGESLAARIKKSPLSVEEALAIARQLIDALEAAHENGVVHRDLKPANIQITPDGLVKVLDFGLAKVEAGDGASTETSLSPTMTRDGTQAGIILGTAPYMSPEQARGLPVDKRSDIFSFGGVVFEMLTGRRAFEGELVSDIMASVIKSEPDWSLLPSSAGGLRILLARCLAKDPKQRLRDIGDARIELEDGARARRDGDVASNRISRRRAFMLAAVSALVVAAVTGVLVSQRAPTAVLSSGVTRFQTEVGGFGMLALAPDGRTLARSSGQGVRARSLEAWESRMLYTVEDQRIRRPFFSPDGKWVGFENYDENGLYKIPTEGGVPIRLSELPPVRAGATWTEQGTILIGGTGGVWEVDDSGGSLNPLVTLPENERVGTPVMLPGGGAVLFDRSGAAEQSIVVADLRSGDIETLIPDGIHPHYLPNGVLVYVSGTTLMSVPFDVDTLALTGAPASLIDGIAVQAGQLSLAFFAVSRSGTLAYLPDSMNATLDPSLVVVDPARVGDATATAFGDVRVSRDPRVSPDGTRLAAHIQGGENDIWNYEFERGTMSRLTLEPGEDETPVWSPDGRFVAFASQRDKRRVLRVRADGSEPPELLWETEHHTHVSDWSADGRWLVMDVGPVGELDVWTLDMEADNDAPPLIESRFHESMARISPDGRYLAYVSDESGGNEVYLQRFPELGGKRQISNGGGQEPAWGRDGRKLYYRSPTHVMAVDVRLGPDIEISAPVSLIADNFVSLPGGRHTIYDVMPDGRLIFLDYRDARGADVNVVVNWVEELEARVPR